MPAKPTSRQVGAVVVIFVAVAVAGLALLPSLLEVCLVSAALGGLVTLAGQLLVTIV